MKKSMFITSVIMVVVLAIALTTSSLAWYNGAAGAQNVTAGSLSVTAQEASAGQGLVISTDGASFGTGNVTLGDEVEGMTPAAPLNCPGANVKTELTASIATAQNFGNVVLIPGATIDTVKEAEEKISVSNVVYVASTGHAVTPEIDVVFTVDEDDADAAVLWVAVLASTDGNTWQIVKIEASKDRSMTVFNTADLPDDSGTLSTLLTNNYDLSAVVWDQIELEAAVDAAWGDPVRYKAVAWYDGASLVNSNSDTSISYSIKFTDGGWVDSQE